MIESTLAEKYQQNWTTDQNTHQTNYHKVLASSKSNPNWGALAVFSPRIYQNDKMGHVQVRKLQNCSFHGQALLETKCKRFRNIASRRNFNVQPDWQIKKSQWTTQLCFSIQGSKIEVVSIFLHFTSKPHSRTSSETCILKTSGFF